MAGHLVVVGSLNMDLVVRSPRHPQPGETLLGGPFMTFPGGKGANQAVAAARVGGIVSMVGRVGSDEFGGVLLQNLASSGVNATHVLRDATAATGVALITVSDDGQNTIVVAPGANGQVSPADVQAAYPAFEETSVLMLQLEIPIPAVVRAVEEARRRQIQVILNPAPAQPLEQSLLRQVDFLVPNRSELALLTGEADVEPGARALLASGVKHVVVTLGDEGVVVWDASGATPIAPLRVTAVDTTAAGDAFVGAFAVALSQGRTPIEAARWGNAAGAVAVTRAGAQPSLPTRSEVEAMLARG